jgi:hypothetical protein
MLGSKIHYLSFYPLFNNDFALLLYNINNTFYGFISK